MKRDKLIQIEFDFDSKESEEPVQNNFNFEKKSEDVPQGVFDFDTGNPDGFENFHKEREELLDKVRKEWRIPIGKIVRIKLFDIDGEFEGKLKLTEHPKEINRRHPLYLKVGDTPSGNATILVASVKFCNQPLNCNIHTVAASRGCGQCFPEPKRLGYRVKPQSNR